MGAAFVAADPSIAGALRAAARALEGSSTSPHLDAQLLLGKVLGLTRTALVIRSGQRVPAADAEVYAGLIARRIAGEPVAYLTGTREFWSLEIAVTPAVLVPRPETEVLVEQALRAGTRGARCAMLDLGTGSGAIALAVSRERPDWTITAVDSSREALEVARGNATALGCSNIDWRLGDWFGAVRGERFDLIAGNPPYIAAGDPALPALRAEPRIALTPGPTGLEALATIIAQAAPHLRARGTLLLEHGADQAAEVAALLRAQDFTDIRSIPDLSGKSRVTTGTVQPKTIEENP
jgi:release factor glutamine methyltransferase